MTRNMGNIKLGRGRVTVDSKATRIDA